MLEVTLLLIVRSPPVVATSKNRQDDNQLLYTIIGRLIIDSEELTRNFLIEMKYLELTNKYNKINDSYRPQKINYFWTSTWIITSDVSNFYAPNNFSTTLLTLIHEMFNLILTRVDYRRQDLYLQLEERMLLLN